MSAALCYDGAPRAITEAEAVAIAEREYGYRHSHRDAAWILLSMGADGSWHHRGSVASETAARDWAAEKRAAFVSRILAGECTFTIFYDSSRDRFYSA